LLICSLLPQTVVVRWLVAPCLLLSFCAFAAPPNSRVGLGTKASAKNNTSHSGVQDVVDAIVRGEGVHGQLARARSMGKEAEVAERLEELSLNVTHPDRMRNIAFALVALKRPSSEATLLRLTQSTDSGTRMYAAQGLGLLKSKDGISRLVSMLTTDRIPGVRREVARALGALRVQSAAADLFETARAETDPDARAAELIAVGQVGGKKQIDSLEAVIEIDGRESTRRAAARALCALGAEAGFDYVKKLLASDDPEDRIAGVRLLDDARVEDAARLLGPLLTSKDVRLAATAAHTLYTCGDAKMLDWLVVHSATATLDHRLIYEEELENMGLTEEQRHDILARHSK
jgi:hypothetical protein